jgi:uncharacterized protein (TIGR02246 family)
MQRLHLAVTAALTVAVVVLGVLLWRAGDNGGAPPARAAAPLTPEDEAAVRGLVSEFANTWNRHDMKAMHDLDTEDVHWVNVSGNHWRGKATVYKGHDTIHRTFYAKSPMAVEQVEVRSIAPDVAVAVGTMKFAPGTIPGATIPEMRTRGSFAAVKRDGVWKFAHFQNTTINEEHEKNDPVTWDEKGFVPPKKDGDKLEQEIRKIDQAEAAAVLAGDVPAIEKFWGTTSR